MTQEHEPTSKEIVGGLIAKAADEMSQEDWLEWNRIHPTAEELKAMKPVNLRPRIVTRGTRPDLFDKPQSPKDS